MKRRYICVSHIKSRENHQGLMGREGRRGEVGRGLCASSFFLWSNLISSFAVKKKKYTGVWEKCGNCPHQFKPSCCSSSFSSLRTADRVGSFHFIHFTHMATVMSLFIRLHLNITQEACVKNHKLLMSEGINRNTHITVRHFRRWKHNSLHTTQQHRHTLQQSLLFTCDWKAVCCTPRTSSDVRKKRQSCCQI